MVGSASNPGAQHHYWDISLSIITVVIIIIIIVISIIISIIIIIITINDNYGNNDVMPTKLFPSTKK